jgi:hypothetical protein
MAKKVSVGFEGERWEQFEDDGWESLQNGRKADAAKSARKATAIDTYVILGRSAPTAGERIAFPREGVRVREALFEGELISGICTKRRFPILVHA